MKAYHSQVYAQTVVHKSSSRAQGVPQLLKDPPRLRQSLISTFLFSDKSMVYTTLLSNSDRTGICYARPGLNPYAKNTPQITIFTITSAATLVLYLMSPIIHHLHIENIHTLCGCFLYESSPIF